MSAIAGLLTAIVVYLAFISAKLGTLIKELQAIRRAREATNAE